MTKRFRIEISFISGDQVQARIEARNKKDAMRRLMAMEQFQQFAIQCGDIVGTSIEAEETKPVDKARFVVTNVEGKHDWYVVADLDNRIKVDFKKGHYNDMQKVSYFGKEEDIDALREATALREIGEFMFENFKELV